MTIVRPRNRVTRPRRVLRPAPAAQTQLQAALRRRPVQMQPAGLLMVRQGPGRHVGILPPTHPGAAPQHIQGLLGVSAHPRGGLLGFVP